jgi:hypothetical protein
VRTEVIEGMAALPALEGAADADSADLFVLGIGTLGPVGGVRLDRLPMRLVHHTHLPVVMVPPQPHRMGGATSAGAPRGR